MFSVFPLGHSSPLLFILFGSRLFIIAVALSEIHSIVSISLFSLVCARGRERIIHERALRTDYLLSLQPKTTFYSPTNPIQLEIILFPSTTEKPSSFSNMSTVSISKYPNESIDRTKDTKRLELIEKRVSQLRQFSVIIHDCCGGSERTNERTSEQRRSDQRKSIDQQNPHPSRNRPENNRMIPR